jgi:Domain of unknown function (DUF3806)
VRFRSKPRSEVQESVEPLNEAELEWVAANVAAARGALRETGLEPDGELTAESLDELWALLLAEQPDDPNVSINLVGLAFGQLLVDRFGLTWVALTDEHGTEVAVRGPSELTVFPTNFVAKRYEASEAGFLAPFADEVARTLGQLR